MGNDAKRNGALHLMSMFGIYAAYDLDGTEVCRGTLKDLSVKFRLQERSITKKIYLGTRIDKKYLIKRIGWAGVKTSSVPLKKTRDSDRYEYLKTHLLIYGNTGCTFDPVPYLPRLYDEGLDCRVKEVDLTRTGAVTGRHRKKDVYYVLEVV